MQVSVKLPSDQLIHYLKFCRVIADAVSPIDKDIVGIKCVRAKTYPIEKTNEHLSKVPFFLDEMDREALAKLLPNLPPLSYPMSLDQVAAFMEAYVNLPDRPIWMPVLITEETIHERKVKHDQTMDRHLEAIRKECNAGLLVAVDANHVPLDFVQIGAHIPRRDAIAYLVRCGIAFEDEIVKSPEQNILSSKTPHQTGKMDRNGLIGVENRVGAKRFTAAQKEDAVRRSNELKGIAHDFVKQVADEYGVTVRTIDNWIRVEKNADKLRQIQGIPKK